MPWLADDHALDLIPHVEGGRVVGMLPDDAGLLVEVPGSARSTYVTKPLTAQVGWRAVCSCGAWATTLVGPHMPAAQEELHVVAEHVWHRDHLSPARALAAVDDAQHAVAAALRRLDEAVHEARRQGATWDAIGHAAAMTRQSAHGRWATTAATTADGERAAPPSS